MQLFKKQKKVIVDVSDDADFYNIDLQRAVETVCNVQPADAAELLKVTTVKVPREDEPGATDDIQDAEMAIARYLEQHQDAELEVCTIGTGSTLS